MSQANTPPSFNHSEMQRLLALWCNDELTSHEAARLERMIESVPEARRLYFEYATLEADLHSSVAGAPMPASLPITASLTDYVEPAQRSRHEPIDFWRRGWVVAVAASMLALASIATVQSRFKSVRVASDQADQADPVARVSATRNCRWADESSDIGYGSPLVAGQKVHLADGLAEITFNDGASLLIEGPAELRLQAIDPSQSELGAESRAQALLLSGRLAATVPTGSRSPVMTDRLGLTLVADERKGDPKGLHFGLSADGVSGDEVHVFRGLAEAYLRPERGRPALASVFLSPSEAARLRPQSTTVAKFFANSDKFVRSLASTSGPHDGLYSYEGFDYPGGPLSGQNGGFGWAGAWADIEAACPPGEIATNVVQIDNLPFGALQALGGHAAQTAQQNRIRRALSTSLGGVFDAAGLVENQDGHRLIGANGKTVYLSFLQRVDLSQDGFYGFELHRGDGNGNRVLCIGNGAEGAGYGVTSNYNAYGRSNYAKLGAENDAVNFIVVKIEYGPEHRDLVTVYRNPESLLTERAARIDARLRGNFAFDRVSFGNFDGKKTHRVDELRVGTTYRAVTGRRDRNRERIGPPLAIESQRKNGLPLAAAVPGLFYGGLIE